MFNQIVQKCRIFGGAETMADAVSLQFPNCRPDRLGPNCFTRMNSGTQSFAGSTCIDALEEFRSSPPLIAAKADAHNAVTELSQFQRFIQHSFSGFDAKMPDRVEDPIERHPEVALATQATTLQAFEQRSELASSPVNHSDTYTSACLTFCACSFCIMR